MPKKKMFLLVIVAVLLIAILGLTGFFYRKYSGNNSVLKGSELEKESTDKKDLNTDLNSLDKDLDSVNSTGLEDNFSDL